MSFEYHRPPSLPEALAILTAQPGRYPVLAGGTDLIVQWRNGLISPAGVVDISGLSELRGISQDEDHVEIGALETHASIAASEIVRAHLPALAQACATVGAVQIQNRGTIGGNVMNASPAGDSLPPLLCYGAEFLAQDLTGERWIGVQDMFPGYRKTALKPNELLTRVRIAKPENKEISGFYKVGARSAQAISKVCLCARASVSHGSIVWIKISVGSVAPTAVRAPGTEALLTGKVLTDGLMEMAKASLADEVHPIDDVRSTADYRRFACAGLLARFLRELRSSARTKPSK